MLDPTEPQEDVMEGFMLEQDQYKAEKDKNDTDVLLEELGGFDEDEEGDELPKEDEEDEDMPDDLEAVIDDFPPEDTVETPTFAAEEESPEFDTAPTETEVTIVSTYYCATRLIGTIRVASPIIRSRVDLRRHKKRSQIRPSRQ